MIISRAPVRILDIGGWTDTWFYPNGAVFNVSIDLYSYSRIMQNNLQKTRIIAEDLNQEIEIKNLNDITYDGTLDLIKAALKRLNVNIGLNIQIKADAPPGCGTGTSASIAVSLLSSLAYQFNLNLNPYQIAQTAHKLETEELNLESGVQDQFAATFGGINFMEIHYPEVKITKIKIDKKKKLLLESQLILIYLGTRSSSEMHKAVINNYLNKNQETLDSFEKMKVCAYEMKKLIKSDLSDIGYIMNQNWEAQKKLHSLMTNDVIRMAERISNNHKSLGFKCNGAGGGGSALILADIGKEYKLKNDLIKNGFQILPFKLCFDGVFTCSI